MGYEKNRRDDNELAIVGFWRSIGREWVQMPRDVGFDGLLICPLTGIHIVEIKNPVVKWKLTPAEQARKLQIERAGGRYELVETLADAARICGAADL